MTAEGAVLICKIVLLRYLLLTAGFGWGLTVVGVFLPWDFAVEHLQTFGGSGPIPDDPMMQYWMRMASGAFAIVGLMFLLAAWKPRQYANIIPILGLCSIVEGGVLLFYGVYLEIGLFPFIADLFIAFVPGVGILALKGEAQR